METIQQHMSETTRQAFDLLVWQVQPRLREHCAPRDADLFLIRLSRYFADLYEPLSHLYGARDDFQRHLAALLEQMVDAYIARPESMRLLDIERHITPDWFQHQSMVGYVCYLDLFAGTLKEVSAHIPYLQELGITYLHLMPVLEPRPDVNDGGYAVKNYCAVDPRLGTMQELVTLAKELQTVGISLCIDLVINHTAQEHAWAQKAMAGDPVYLDYYYTFDDRVVPDQYEQTLREVFPDFAPGNFTWFPEMAGTGKWVWTTFNSFQWDLNYHNPAVFCEMAATMLFLANQGVDILRLDAVPFIWKAMGTDCENQPEAHLLVQAFRAVMRVVAPGVIFKAEAIVPPDKLVPYMGTGTAVGKECELAYNNQLMVLLWSTLATRKVNLLTHTLHQMPPAPPGSTWLTYVRNHDDIGWAVTDELASAVGEDAFLHRQFLNDFYSGTFVGSFAQGALFQFNAVTQDARISGSTASLVGLERSMDANSPHDEGTAVRRIVLLHSVIMAFGGIPIIYMGDELGLLNDYGFAADPVKARDNRWLHRPPMDWHKAAQRHDSQSLVGRIYTGLRQLITARVSLPALHGSASVKPVWTDNQHVFALVRRHPQGSLLLLANFHEYSQHVTADLVEYAGLRGVVRNVLDPVNGQHPVSTDGRIHLTSYQTMWLVEA